jgi:hypothetical protein
MSYIPQISIDGGDLTGKTTLQKALFNKSLEIGKKLFISDRSVLTQLIYSDYFKRRVECLDSWNKDFIDFLSTNGLILLTLKESSVRKRYEQRGDDTYNLDKILKINDQYNEKVKSLVKIPFVKIIEADDKTLDSVVDSLNDWLLFMHDRRMSDQVNNLYYLIDSLGTMVGSDIKELRNIRLNQYTNSLRSEQFFDLMEFYSNYSRKTEKHEEYDMAIENHAIFYAAFKQKLAYIIKKEIVMNHEDPLLTRRFHVTNDQGGCINTLGINFRKNNSNRIDMNITANLRSSDIAVLPFDLFGIYIVCEDLIKPQNAKILPQSVTKKIQNFFITINIDSAHIINPEKVKKHYENYANNRKS